MGLLHFGVIYVLPWGLRLCIYDRGRALTIHPSARFRKSRGAVHVCAVMHRKRPARKVYLHPDDHDSLPYLPRHGVSERQAEQYQVQLAHSPASLRAGLHANILPDSYKDHWSVRRWLHDEHCDEFLASNCVQFPHNDHLFDHLLQALEWIESVTRHRRWEKKNPSVGLCLRRRFPAFINLIPRWLLFRERSRDEGARFHD